MRSPVSAKIFKVMVLGLVGQVLWSVSRRAARERGAGKTSQPSEAVENFDAEGGAQPVSPGPGDPHPADVRDMKPG